MMNWMSCGLHVSCATPTTEHAASPTWVHHGAGQASADAHELREALAALEEQLALRDEQARPG